MKKSIKVLIAFVLIVLLSGCGAKKGLSKKEINNKLFGLGFDIYDVTDKIEDKSVKTVLSANYKGKYQIEYYAFDNEDSAEKAFKSNKNELIKSNGDKGKTKSGSNYDRYIQQLSDKYIVVTRVDNTLVYVFSNIDYKKDIKKVLKKINYY